MPCHILGDRGQRNFDAKLEQLAVDSRRAPQGVVLAHPPNELANVERDRRPSGAARARFPSPVPAKSVPVPADDGLGLENDEGGQASGPQTIEPDPECPVEGREPGSHFPLPPQDVHLMAQDQDLELKLGPGPKPHSHDGKPKSQDIAHAPSLRRFANTPGIPWRMGYSGGTA